MKYRVTQMGFIGHLVRPGDVIELDGPPPIAGLVPVVSSGPDPVADEKPAAPAKAPRKSRPKQPAQPDEGEADII